MTLMRRASKVGQDAVLLVDEHVLPQTLAVIETRAEPLGIDVVVADLTGVTDAESLSAAAGGRPVFGVLVQYPGADGGCATGPPSPRPPTRRAPWSRSPPTCSP